jgi:hypothetical protein
MQVTLPQLSLLEVALAEMPRIDAFILQRSGGAGGNVFWVRIFILRCLQYIATNRGQANGAEGRVLAK